MSNSTKKLLIYSPQGGTGKSIIATNLAILSSFYDVKVLLIDLSVFGSVSSLLRLYTKSQNNISTLVNIIRENGDINFNDFTNNIMKILNNNLFVLQNCNATKMVKLTISEINKILNAATSSYFDLIIMDTSSELNKKNFFLFENTDSMLIPTIQDIACTWKVLQFKELIDQNFMKNIELYTALNKCNKSSNFNNSKYELDIGIKNIFQFPYYSKNFQSYINQGYMINSQFNKSFFADFSKFTQLLLNELGLEYNINELK
jgi:MinD-like ATPase involved in chromosome partitioning or flagellar assembly